MRFWDSSALVPLLIAEEAAGRLAALLEIDDNMAVWWGTLIECDAALARRQRDGSLQDADASAARSRLSRYAGIWSEIAPSNQVRDQARRHLRIHSLRAADALQLAAALAFANHEPAGVEFVCLDERLADAAAREGFSVVG